MEGLLNKKVNSTTQVRAFPGQFRTIVPFALGGRLVHFKSKGDMPAPGLMHLFTLPQELNKNLPIDQEPAQNSFKSSKLV